MNYFIFIDYITLSSKEMKEIDTELSVKSTQHL